MTDIPYRVYGPQPLNAGAGETLYTAPTGTSKFFLRDLTFTNTSGAGITVRCTLGDIASPGKRVVDQSIPTGNPTSLRPLWLMDAGETLQGLQVISTAPVTTATGSTLASGTDATSYTLPAWTPSANTMYLLCQTNGVASGTTALNPSSITGNGTWTNINQTTSTVSAATNIGVSAWWWFSTNAGSNATTVVNFASTQHSFVGAIYSVTNIYAGTVAVPPWTSSATAIIQSAVAADTTAPGSTTSSKTVTLATVPQAGYAFYYAARATIGTPVTPPSGFSENREAQIDDLSGSAGPAVEEMSTVTTPPWTSATLGPCTFTTATTAARASIGWEMVPGGTAGAAGWVNCMISGIEVH